MMKIDEIIDQVIQNPTEEHVVKYYNKINELEYNTLHEAEFFPQKTQEYFNKRTEAFSIRRKYAAIVIKNWIQKYGSINGCFCTYADTLNIPFQQIKNS